MAYNAYNAYKQQTIMSMTPGEMVVKLLEGCEKQLNFAVICIKEKNAEGANNSLQKAQDILKYLKASLDDRYPVAQGLNSLYTFFLERVMAANISKDPVPVEEVLPLVSDLADTFRQAERLARIQ